jgi:hypothetical protein
VCGAGNGLERGEGGAGTVLYVGAGGESGSFPFEGRRRRRSNDFFWDFESCSLSVEVKEIMGAHVGLVFLSGE